jgi:MFS transporter, ACS family, DAL5 transporter family protein
MLANKQYDAEDVKKLDSRTSVAEVTVDTVLDPQQRAKAERALVRKLDMRLMPMIALVFIMNYIGESTRSLVLMFHSSSCAVDRTAVTSARLKGMEADLGISGG